jgi:hypothetical protein
MNAFTNTIIALRSSALLSHPFDVMQVVAGHGKENLLDGIRMGMTLPEDEGENVGERGEPLTLREPLCLCGCHCACRPVRRLILNCQSACRPADRKHGVAVHWTQLVRFCSRNRTKQPNSPCPDWVFIGMATSTVPPFTHVPVNAGAL